MEKINGGATIWARQTIESDIFLTKPDKWFKIWFYIVNKVKFMDNGRFNRGQNFIKYAWIEDATGATKNQVDMFIRWAKEVQMLTTQKTTRGMIVNVLKYEIYQDLDSYENDTENETLTKQKRNINDTILKNDKNDKNEEEGVFSEKNIPTPKTPRNFLNQRRQDIGKEPMRTPRSEKQVQTFEALKWKDYFRDQGSVQHGMEFFKVTGDKREKVVSKLIINAHGQVNLKELIDWWFEGEGEWAGYEPEQCFAGKTLERFMNRGKGKKENNSILKSWKV